MTSDVVFLGTPLPTMHSIARIGLVDYYGRVFTANDPQGRPKEARKPHNSSRKRSAKIRYPLIYKVLAPPPPAWPILLKCWLKMRKSILNNVTQFQIPTPNRLGARIEKSAGGICPRAKNRVKCSFHGSLPYSRPVGVKLTSSSGFPCVAYLLTRAPLEGRNAPPPCLPKYIRN